MTTHNALEIIDKKHPEKPHQNKWHTVASFTNTIVGSAILVLPSLTKDSGIMNILILAAVVGFINYYTCNLFLMHLTEEDNDISDSVLRILGTRWQKFLGIASGIYNISCTVVFYVLLCNMFFPMVSYLMMSFGETNIANKFEFTLDKFSFQYASIIVIIPCVLMLYISLKWIIKFSCLGSFPLFAYVIFILYYFIDSQVHPETRITNVDVKYFSTNFSAVVGTFGMAFFSHTSFAPIAKASGVSPNTSSCLGISYVISFFCYIFISYLGYFAIANKFVSKINNIMDYFPQDSLFPFIIQILYTLKLSSVYPVLAYTGKYQLLSSISKNAASNPLYNHLLNLIISILSFLTGFFCIDPVFIISINGAVLTFVIIFVTPFFMHWKCIYGTKEKSSYMTLLNKNLLKCNEHRPPRLSKNQAFGLYLLFFLFGTYVLIVQLINMFN